MSSTSAPFGFRPSYHNSGQIRPKAYTIATGQAVSIFAGDPVKLVDAGVIQLGTSDGSRTGTVDDVLVLGVFAGVEYRDSTGKPVISPFWVGGTAATEITAWVYDDPETLFDVQYANPGTPGTDSVQTAVGENCDWAGFAAPGGSTATGISTGTLSAIVATPGQFQITGFARNVNDSLTDAYVTATIRINQHQYKAAVASV